MNRSCGRPAVEVASVSLTPDGIVPSSTIRCISSSVEGAIIFAPTVLRVFPLLSGGLRSDSVRDCMPGSAILVDIIAGEVELYFFLLIGGSISALALMWFICSVSGSSTWLGSGVLFRFACIIFFYPLNHFAIRFKNIFNIYI